MTGIAAKTLKLYEGCAQLGRREKAQRLVAESGDPGPPEILRGTPSTTIEGLPAGRRSRQRRLS